MSKPWDGDPERHPHGSRSRYTSGKCRCVECKEANRLYYHELQRRKLELVKELSPAPVPQTWTTPSGEKKIRIYKRACPGVDGVPCPTRSHLRKDSKGPVCNRCRRRVGGTGYVSADKAREHILMLSRQGIGYKQVAESSNVGATIIADVRSGRRKRILGKTEWAILRADTSARGDGSLVFAAPTHKLLRKLLKKGYTKTELALRLGSKAKTPCLQLLNTRSVTVKSAHRVQKLYNTILEEERVEEEIYAEMHRFCTQCGLSHSKRPRLEMLRKRLPATTTVLQEVYACLYDGDKNSAAYRGLLRDLHDIGAKQEEVGSPWELK